MDRSVKISVAASGLFLLLLAYVGAQYVLIYDALYKVDIEIDRVTVDELFETRASVTISVDVSNPGLVAVRMTRLQWDIYLNGQRVGTSVLNPNRLIAPGEVYVSTRKLDMTYHAQTLLRAREQNEWRWRIQGSARFDTPLLKMQTPFEELITSSD